jgi:hypothetical protein
MVERFAGSLMAITSMSNIALIHYNVKTLKRFIPGNEKICEAIYHIRWIVGYAFLSSLFFVSRVSSRKKSKDPPPG